MLDMWKKNLRDGCSVVEKSSICSKSMKCKYVSNNDNMFKLSQVLLQKPRRQMKNPIKIYQYQCYAWVGDRGVRVEAYKTKIHYTSYLTTFEKFCGLLEVILQDTHANGVG